MTVATPSHRRWDWPRKLVTRGLPLIAGLAVLVLVIAWMSGAFREKIPPGQAEVTPRQHAGEPTTEVARVEKDYVEEAVGTLKAAERTVVSAKLLARIQAMQVSAGDAVEQGDPLIELEAGEYAARVEQAAEAVRSADAQRKQAASDFERAQKLKEQGVITQAAFDERQREVQVAEANHARAEQQLAEARVILGYTKIAAPKAGRIVDRLAEPGDIVSPGQPLLTLYDPETLRLEVPVMEHLAVKLHPGTKVRVRIDALDREVEGTVAQRVPQAEAASRSFLVKVDLENQYDLFEGMFGRLLIPAGSRSHLCLATDAIQTIGQLQFVDVLRDDGTLERRFIKTGRKGFPGKVEVLSGVEAGEQVILHPGHGDDSAHDTESDSGHP